MAELGLGKSQPAGTGRPHYDPADLLKPYRYGYLHQVRSSRRLERECQRNVELMWLLNRLVPDHKTIAEFRRRDGVAVRAVASRKAVLSRERLLKEQTAQGLSRLEALGTAALKIVADAGYSNGPQAEALEAQGVVLHIPANRAVNNQRDGAFLDRTSIAYDEASDTLRCPVGKSLRRKQLQRGKHRHLRHVIGVGILHDLEVARRESRTEPRRGRTPRVVVPCGRLRSRMMCGRAILAAFSPASSPAGSISAESGQPLSAWMVDRH